MKKSRLTKRIASFGLVFLLSINSFAAVVSDNDGSAFITKAEFDSLKSNFQSQIDQYNTSIDSKIDGAIASYLSGMSLTSSSEKKILIGDSYKMVGYYDDKDLIKYVYPKTGMDFAYTYMRQPNQGTGFIEEAFQLNATVFKAAQSAQAGNEPTVNKNSSGSGLSWIWSGMYKGVTEVITTVGSGSATFSEGNDWPYRTDFSVRGPILSDELTGLNMNWTSSKTIWKYEVHWASERTAGVPKEQWWTYNKQQSPYGGFASVNHTLAMSYGNETSGDYKNGKLDAYVIAYKHSPSSVNMCVNYSNNENSFAPGKVGNNIYTDTAQKWWDGVTIDQKTVGVYHAKNYTGCDAIAEGFTKHATLNTAPKSMTDWDNTVYMPVIGGVGELAGNQIRQELDGLMDSTVGDQIKLSNISLSAGLPVCIERATNEIKWEVRFLDTSKNYKVWLSYSPFDTAGDYGNPANATDYVKITNNKTANPYMPITHGQGIIEWTMEKTAPVYCKWCIDDNGVDKCGGQLDLSTSGKYTQVLVG